MATAATKRENITAGNADPFRLTMAKNFVRNGYQDAALSLSSVAALVGVSSCYLSRLFSVRGDVGFREYVRLTRMQRAALLLKDPKLRIKEIAQAVGYAHVTVFDRDFRLHFGVPPNKFRANLAASRLVD
jgi:two-component system response regulator YesN